MKLKHGLGAFYSMLPKKDRTYSTVPGAV